MEAERKRVANELRSTGSAEAEKIRADADRQREVILAEAYRDAQRIKRRGRRQGGGASTPQAFSQNPEFYSFYRAWRPTARASAARSDLHAARAELGLLPLLQGLAAGKPGRARNDAPWAPTFLMAFALMLVIEGVLPFLAPNLWRETFRRIMQLSDGQIRFFGLTSMIVGLLLLLVADAGVSDAVRWLLPEHIEDMLPAEAMRIEALRRAILDLFFDSRLRAGDAAAARVHGLAAHRHRPRPRPAHLQAGRPALGPHDGRARRHHAAGGAHRRAPAQPQGRDAPVLLRQRAARAPAGARPRRASRSRSAPRSTATPASRATSRSRRCCARRSRSPACKGARMDIGHVAVFRAHGARGGRRRASSRRSCSRRCSRRTFLRLKALTQRARREDARTRCCCCPSLYGGAEVLDAAEKKLPRIPDAEEGARDAARAREGLHDSRRASTSPSCAATTTTPAWCSTRTATASAGAGGARRALRRGRQGLRPARVRPPAFRSSCRSLASCNEAKMQRNERQRATSSSSAPSGATRARARSSTG